MDTLLTPRPDAAAAAAHSGKSAASWPAIIAGAFVAAGISLILLALGSGLGFASLSPWSGQGVSGATFTVATAIWLIVTQWISACFAGYIAGRLRTRWIGTHSHEVFFRDTAHGLVTWAVATVLIAAIVGSSLLSVVRGGAQALSGAVSTSVRSLGAAGTADRSPGELYSTDKLFRPAAVGDAAQGGVLDAADVRLQAAHVMANALATGGMPDGDRAYLAALIASRTGLSPADADKRVDDWVSRAMETEMKVKASADAARKAAAEGAIYASLALLIGAFIASVSAALGGRLRDEHP